MGWIYLKFDSRLTRINWRQAHQHAKEIKFKNNLYFLVFQHRLILCFKKYIKNILNPTNILLLTIKLLYKTRGTLLHTLRANPAPTQPAATFSSPPRTNKHHLHRHCTLYWRVTFNSSLKWYSILFHGAAFHQSTSASRDCCALQWFFFSEGQDSNSW